MEAMISVDREGWAAPGISPRTLVYNLDAALEPKESTSARLTGIYDREPKTELIG
jgi:hypothetical protein